MFGWGYQPFSQFLQHGYTFSVSSFPAQHLHNDYISYFATYGLIGLLGWIGTLILLARQAVNDPLRLAMIAVMACMGLTECMWSFTHFVLYVFFITWTLLWLSVNPIKDKMDILK